MFCAPGSEFEGGGSAVGPGRESSFGFGSSLFDGCVGDSLGAGWLVSDGAGDSMGGSVPGISIPGPVVPGAAAPGSVAPGSVVPGSFSPGAAPLRRLLRPWLQWLFTWCGLEWIARCLRRGGFRRRFARNLSRGKRRFRLPFAAGSRQFGLRRRNPLPAQRCLNRHAAVHHSWPTMPARLTISPRPRRYARTALAIRRRIGSPLGETRHACRRDYGQHA